MALARREFTVVDEAGNIVTDAQVEVRREVAGQPLAAIYSDREGATPLANPFSVDPTTAVAAFHVAGGAYRIRAFRSGFERIERYVGIGTASEFDAVEGIALIQNVDAGYALVFEGLASPPVPSSGAIQFDNADLSLATEAYVSAVNAAGSSIVDRLLELYDVDRTIKDMIIVSQNIDGENFQASWRVDGATAVGSPPQYVVLAISQHNGETTFDAGPVNLQRERAGADGAMETSGSVTAGQIARYADTSGGVLEGANLGDSPPTPAVIGDDAGVRAATPGDLIHAGHLESAAAAVALTDAATVAVDWDSGINFTLEITANRVLGNPTNGQPGTWRTVLVDSDAGPDTLTFGNQYGGELPTLADITSTKKYLLMLFCKSATQFLVTAIDGSDA